MAVEYSCEFDVPKSYARHGSILQSEDSDMALVLEPLPDGIAETGPDGCFFVRLQSWDDDKKHPLMSRLMGKRVRVSVEILD